MRFMICKIGLGYDEKPIEEAYPGTYTKVDVRNVSNPKDILMFRGNPKGAVEYWYGCGDNHRVVNGHIVRDFLREKCYYVDIDNIEKLIELRKKYGNLSIEDSDNLNGMSQITIL